MLLSTLLFSRGQAFAGSLRLSGGCAYALLAVRNPQVESPYVAPCCARLHYDQIVVLNR